MIVIASDNPAVADVISTLLKQKGDLFVVASDESPALSAIRADRANLLIVDTGSSAFDGFALCRQVKDDASLRGLPVLCIMDLSDPRAILSFLDAEGDAFLTPPFDLSSLSAAIGDLQARQAGGMGPGSARTRYKISQDGREYSVVADRRALLEYLIAAFESAVRVDGEKGRVQSDLQGEIRSVGERLAGLISERDATVATLHRELEERDHVLSRLNGTLQAKDQAEALLKTRMENIAVELKELGGVLETVRRSDEEKSRTISALRADLDTAVSEKTGSEQKAAAAIHSLEMELKETVFNLESSRSVVAGLNVKTSGLERELSSIRADRDRDKDQIRSLSLNLEKTVAERDERQKTCDRLEEALRATREAAQAKEQEVRSALDNVTRDLNAIEDALEQNLRQLERELAARKQLEQQAEILVQERDAQSRVADAWQQKCRGLENALQKAESTLLLREQEVKTALDNVNSDLHAIQGALEQNLRQLGKELSARREVEQRAETLEQERYRLSRSGEEAAEQLKDARSKLAAEQDSLVRLQTECDAISAELTRVQDVLGKTYRELERLQGENKSLLDERDRSSRAAGEAAGLRKAVEEIRADLASGKSALDSEQCRRAEADAKLAALQQEHTRTRQFLDSASRDIGVLNTALQEEREKNRTAEDRLRAAENECREKDRAIFALREKLDAVRSDIPVAGPVTAGWESQEVLAPHVSTGSTEHRSPSPFPETPSSSGPSVPGPEAPGVPAGPVLSPEGPVPETGTPVDQPAAAPPEPDMDLATVPSGQAGRLSGDLPVSPLRMAFGDLVISRERWLDITKWAHHTPGVTEEQRKDLIANLMRLSKLVQKDRHLTTRQDQEIRALVARVQSLGYRFV